MNYTEQLCIETHSREPYTKVDEKEFHNGEEFPSKEKNIQGKMVSAWMQWIWCKNCNDKYLVFKRSI